MTDDRFRNFVMRVANWSPAEVARVSPEQVRHVATCVMNGLDPYYPPFGDAELPSGTAFYPSLAIRDVTAERQRQVEKLGWTPEHDDTHIRDLALPRAAACYALADADNGYSGPFWVSSLRTPTKVWPYLWEWKPKDKRTNLVRAAALLIAEIERIDRAAGLTGDMNDYMEAIDASRPRQSAAPSAPDTGA